MSLNDFEFIKIYEKKNNCSFLKVKSKKNGKFYLLKNTQFQSLTIKEKNDVINEFKLIISLKHPNIIKIINAFYDKPSNSFNILMEFPNNGNLIDKIEFAKKNNMYMEESIIWNVLTQILIVLNYAHKKGIIHKNLKTKYIYLTKYRLIKIINFGVEPSISKNKKFINHLDYLLYSAPEILNNKKYNSKCDIWSVGCIIYELASLSLPFNGKNIEELYNNITKGKIKPIPDFYSNNLKTIINNMLIINPSKRPSSEILLNFKNIKEISNILKTTNSMYINYYNHINLTKKNKKIIDSLNNNIKKESISNLKININNKNDINNKITRKRIIYLHSRNVSKVNSLPLNENLACSTNNDTKSYLKNKIKKIINNSTYRTLNERKIYNQNSEGVISNNINSRYNFFNLDLDNNALILNNTSRIKDEKHLFNNNSLFNNKTLSDLANLKIEPKNNFYIDTLRKELLYKRIKRNKLNNNKYSYNLIDNRIKIISFNNSKSKILKNYINKKEINTKINDYIKTSKENEIYNNRKNKVLLKNENNNEDIINKKFSNHKVIQKKNLLNKNIDITSIKNMFNNNHFNIKLNQNNINKKSTYYINNSSNNSFKLIKIKANNNKLNNSNIIRTKKTKIIPKYKGNISNYFSFKNNKYKKAIKTMKNISHGKGYVETENRTNIPINSLNHNPVKSNYTVKNIQKNFDMHLNINTYINKKNSDSHLNYFYPNEDISFSLSPKNLKTNFCKKWNHRLCNNNNISKNIINTSKKEIYYT